MVLKYLYDIKKLPALLDSIALSKPGGHCRHPLLRIFRIIYIARISDYCLINKRTLLPNNYILLKIKDFISRQQWCQRYRIGTSGFDVLLQVPEYWILLAF